MKTLSELIQEYGENGFVAVIGKKYESREKGQFIAYDGCYNDDDYDDHCDDVVMYKEDGSECKYSSDWIQISSEHWIKIYY